MKRLCSTALIISAGVSLASALETSPSATLSIRNPTGDPWVEAPVIISDTTLVKALASAHFLTDGEEMIPVQYVDLNGDGTHDEAVLVPSILPGVTQVFRAWNDDAAFPLKDRAHAGMYVEGFEGPGWESDLIAFRLYWDERNAMDIFCKREPVLGLKQYALKEVNYHQDTPWGMDVLKVGTALGSGGFGIWQDGKVEKVSKATRDFKVLADGPLHAVIDLKYTDWLVGERKFDLTVRIRSTAGQRFCDLELWLVPKDGGALPEIVAGIVKHEETELIQDAAAGVLGRWGLQALGPGESLHSAHLGMGITVDPADIVAIGEDDVNTFLRLKPRKGNAPIGMTGEGGGHARYRVHASWEHEPAGAKSTKEYEAMLRSVARLQPIVKASHTDGKAP